MSEKLVGNDRRYGFELFCDGKTSGSGAARMMGRSPSHLCELLRELESTPIKKPTDRTWPLRAARSETNPKEWIVCVRSVQEYIKRSQPVEV